MCPEKQFDAISLGSWQLFHGWYYSCHEYILNWLFVHSHSWTQTLCIKQGVSDLHLPRLSSCHDISPQFSSVQTGRQEIWVRCQKFVCVAHALHFTELSSSSLPHYIASPENLHCWVLGRHSCKAFWLATLCMSIMIL